MNKLHVVPHDDRWAVKREGNERASSTHDTQKDAISSARELAKNGDRIVIHSPDGTIRDSIAYNNGATEETTAGRTGGRTMKTQDVAAVGTRVSWSAILAGVVVAFAVYAALGMFSVALGVTTVDEMQSRVFAYSAVVVTVFNLLVALFLGGFVVSRLTVGENKLESVIYGVLLWGTVFGALIVTGAASGIGVSLVAVQADKNPKQSAAVENLTQQLNLTDAQTKKYQEVVNASKQMTADVSPITLMWIGFGATVLSILSAIGGAIWGAGPESVMKAWKERRLAVVKPA